MEDNTTSVHIRGEKASAPRKEGGGKEGVLMSFIGC